jgi:hypothetical protein
MEFVGRAGSLALILLLAFPTRAQAGGVSVAAANPRCNHDQAGILERQVRDYDRRPPAPAIDALTQRDADLSDLLQQAQIERDILHEICSSDERAPIYDQLAGVMAWAYALQADVESKRFSLLKCDATAKEAPQALVASAWAALSTTFSNVAENGATPGPSPTPAPLVAEVMPKIQSRAAAFGLTLPPLRDASAYWRDTLVSKVEPCPASSP